VKFIPNRLSQWASALVHFERCENVSHINRISTQGDYLIRRAFKCLKANKEVDLLRYHDSSTLDEKRDLIRTKELCDEAGIPLDKALRMREVEKRREKDPLYEQHENELVANLNRNVMNEVMEYRRKSATHFGLTRCQYSWLRERRCRFTKSQLRQLENDMDVLISDVFQRLRNNRAPQSPTKSTGKSLGPNLRGTKEDNLTRDELTRGQSVVTDAQDNVLGPKAPPAQKDAKAEQPETPEEAEVSQPPLFSDLVRGL
jgi:hypothetical protein